MTEILKVEPHDPLASSAIFLEWIEKHGVEPNDCYKVEIEWKKEVLTAFCYKRNSEGKKYVDQETKEIAIADPKVIKFRTPFPEMLK